MPYLICTHSHSVEGGHKFEEKQLQFQQKEVQVWRGWCNSSHGVILVFMVVDIMVASGGMNLYFDL
jgi:hypothetical protein